MDPIFRHTQFGPQKNQRPTRLPLASRSAEGDKESRDGIHKIFNLFDDDKTGTVWEDGTYFNRESAFCLKIRGTPKSHIFHDVRLLNWRFGGISHFLDNSYGLKQCAAVPLCRCAGCSHCSRTCLFPGVTVIFSFLFFGRTISLKNLKRVSKELGETMTEEAGPPGSHWDSTGTHGAVTAGMGCEELREMIERADSNGDGQITPEAELLVTHLLTFVDIC